MKHFLIILLISFTCVVHAQQYTDITKIIGAKQITYELRGSHDPEKNIGYTDASTLYYGKCMTLILKNETDTVLYIKIKNGQMLMCEDTAVQDMVVTKPEYFAVDAKQSLTIQLYAMCSEIHDGMPTVHTFYTFGKMADQSLTRITAQIDYLMLHNVAGQSAVWSYTDKASKADLVGHGATEHTLRYTVQILNRAGVITSLNRVKPVKHISTHDSDKPAVQKNKVVKPPVAIEKPRDENIYVNRYVFYSGLITMAVLMSSIVLLLARRKKE